MGFFLTQGIFIGRNKHQQVGQAAHTPFETTRNKAENKHLPRANFDTQMKSFSPQKISCLLKHSWLLETWRKDQERCYKRSHSLLSFQYFPNIILLGNIINQKGSNHLTPLSMSLTLIPRFLFPPVSYEWVYTVSIK